MSTEDIKLSYFQAFLMLFCICETVLDGLQQNEDFLGNTIILFVLYGVGKCIMWFINGGEW